MKNGKYRQTDMYDATNIDTDILLIPFNSTCELKVFNKKNNSSIWFYVIL